MSYALVNGRIFTGEKSIFGRAIVIEDKAIKEILKLEELDTKYPNIEKIDVKGNLISSGFIDLQLNGCGGVLVNDALNRDTLQKMHETNLKYGCTMYAPTLITCSDEKILNSLNYMEKLEGLEDLGVIGLHIEGPYIAKEKRGTHQEKHIRVLSDEIIDKISKSKTTIVTLAPENARVEHIEKLSKAGIKVSIGHTNATYNEVVEKIPHGISMATHLYNAMSSFTHREPGAVGAVLDSSNLTAGIIADGLHVHYSAIRVAHRALGERLFLVTDAASPAGTDIPEFYFEGKKVTHKNGELRNEEGALAGSVLTMIDGVKNLVEHVGLDVQEALKMASIYPAKAVNIDDRYGLVKEGYFADLVILDDKLDLVKTISKGKII